MASSLQLQHMEALLTKKILTKKDVLQLSFRKELDYILNDIKKLNRSCNLEELDSTTRISNSLFSLWTKYGRSFPVDYLTDCMLEVADSLYQLGLYDLARMHGYRRCLLEYNIRSSRLDEEKGKEQEEEVAEMFLSLKEFVISCDDERPVIVALRSSIGDTMCQYFMLKSDDPRLMLESVQKVGMSTLCSLQCVAQLALSRERLYWLGFNSLSFIYAVGREMMGSNHVAPVLKYFLWSAVAMETSIPLIGVKYLPLRSNFYVGACEIYYHLRHPSHAEEFARRALEKVQELAVMHYKANATRDKESDSILKEATIKLGVLIFKRMVFESRRKTKVIFRTRIRQSIKDFLQANPPRSSTEKLLWEMFPGNSARFLAILGTLAPTNWRTLQPWTPPLISDLDSELISDIHQEMFYSGFDMCLRSLYSDEKQTDLTLPLVQHAVQASDHIPTKDILTFVSLCHTYQQKEVTDILMTKIIRVAQMSSVDIIQSRGNLFRLRVLIEQLQSAHKKCSTSSPSSSIKLANLGQTTKGGRTSANANTTTAVSSPRKKKPTAAALGKGSSEDSSGVLGSPLAGRTGGSQVSPRHTPAHSGAGDTAEGKEGGEEGSREKHGEKGGKRKGRNDGEEDAGKKAMLNIPKGSVSQDVSAPGTPAHGYANISQIISEDIKNITPEEVFELLQQALQHFQLTLQTNPSLLHSDPDLLMDSLLVCLEVAKPTFEPINSHDYQTCKVYLLGKDISSKEMDVLVQLVWISGVLNLWQVDPLLHGQHMMKLCCLYEARTEPLDYQVCNNPDSLFLLYDRSLLLKCLEECEKSLEYIKKSRLGNSFMGDYCCSPSGGVGGPGTKEGGEKLYRGQLEELQAEFEYMRLRVLVKLATTIPPTWVAAPGKASTLEEKVSQRQLQKDGQQLLLSQLTSPSAVVKDYQQLRQDCGSNKYLLALLSMLEAVIRWDLSQADKIGKIQESYQLLATINSRRRDNAAKKHLQRTGLSKTNSSENGCGLPASHLVHCSDTKMEFIPPPISSDGIPKGGVAYYRLFGRSAVGSNVRVRTSDTSHPGLGLEVIAESGCRLCVSGLEPNQEYVFAVVAYGPSGQVLAGGIGKTSPPYLATHSLPINTAWGYCSQCAFAVGAEEILKKIGKSLWEHFVIMQVPDSSTKDGRGTSHTHQHELNKAVTSSSSSSHLRHFLYSVLATTHTAIRSGGYLASQSLPLVTKPEHDSKMSSSLERGSGSLSANHAHRMRLIRRLLIALELGGMLNDSGICLQVVVQVYGLLTPFLQHQLPSKDLLRLLMHCHVVLMELPDNMLVHALSPVTYSLHHLMAVAMYYIAKMLASKGNKTLFVAFCNLAKPLLLQTMPAALNMGVASPEIMAEDGEDNKQDHLSASTGRSPAHRTNDSAYHEHLSSLSSINPIAALAQKNVTVKKKKKSRKTLFIMDSIPDDQKTVFYKAVEAFLISRQHGITISEDLDLHGGEDPVILHSIISSQPHLQAYKEVSKFKRRPQYLELMVHFVTTAIGRGHLDKTIEWLLDSFQWLNKRNDIILSSYVPKSNVTALQAQRVNARRPKSTSKGKLLAGANADGPTTAAGASSTSKAGKLGQKSAPGLGGKDSNNSGKVVKVQTAVSSQESVPPKPNSKSAVVVNEAAVQRISGSVSVPTNFSKTAMKKAQWLMIRTSSVAPQVKITKEDLEVKAVYVLMSVLPNLWHQYKARKRLREVCVEEHQWRAQGNLLLAYSYCHQALDRVRKQGGLETGPEGLDEWAVPDKGSGGRGGDREFRFDMSGVIMEGVVPVFTPCVAGKGSKHISSSKLGAVVAARNASRSSSSRESPSHHPTLAPPTQILILESIQSGMKHFLQAAVLAIRGGHWVQLQNVARSLVNTINLLVHTLAHFNPDSTHVILAGVYGMSARPLYVVADGLLDLLSQYFEGSKVPQTASLQVGSCLDSSTSGVGVAFVKQVVFLAIHSLYVHQHWEKVLDLALRFDDITRHSWGELLVPVINIVQSKLAGRVTREKERATIADKLEPAAHLDPGPKGYNIYGLVGHSLFTVPAKYLEEDLTIGRGVVNETRRRSRGANDISSTVENDLVRCRTLLQRYLAGIKRPHLVKESNNFTEQLSDPVCSKKVGVAVLPPTQLSHIVKAYVSVIPELESSGRKELHCQAANELADCYMITGNIRLAAKWWCEGLSCLLHVKEPLANWRSYDCTNMLSGCGLWGCFLGAWMAAKLLKYIYWQQLDVRLECALLAAAFLKVALTFSSHLPTADMAYAFFEPNPFKAVSGVKPFPGVDVFGDVFRCSPSSLVTSLRWTCHELVHRGYAVKALPVLWFYQYAASMMTRAVKETVYSKILRLQNFTKIPVFSLAIRQLNELLIGGGLPQEVTHMQRPPEANWALPNFCDHLPLSDSSNTKVLSQLMEKSVKPVLVPLYGQMNMAKLDIARAQLFIAMAASHPPMHIPNGFSGWIDSLSGHDSSNDRVPVSGFSQLSSTPGQNFQPPNQCLLSSCCPPSPTAMVCPVAGPKFNLSLSAQQRKKSAQINLSQKLLRCCENALGTLAKQLEDQWEAGPVGSVLLELRVEVYLVLALLAKTLLHSKTAYQLSLQAIRLFQVAESCLNGKDLNVNLGSCDLRLWLECRYWVVRSIISLPHPPKGVELLYGGREGHGDGEVGVDVVKAAFGECVRLGEVELMAAVHMGVAEHALSSFPSAVSEALHHSQTCIELLSKLPELSYRGTLLQARASLLLADVTCVQGTESISLPTKVKGTKDLKRNSGTGPGGHIVGKEMVGIFKGLSNSLQDQLEVINGFSNLNAYLQQRGLLASCLLRLAHTHLLLASRPHPPTAASGQLETSVKESHLEPGMEACRRALEQVSNSTHSDPCLVAELKTTYGVLMCASSEGSMQADCLEQLLSAGKMIKDSAIDYRLSYDVLLKLSELHRNTARTKPPATDTSPSAAQPPHHTPVPTQPPTPSPAPLSIPRSLVSSPKISLSAPDSTDAHRSAKPRDSDGDRQKNRSIYLSWAMVKTACQVSSCQQRLMRLVSEAHLENIIKTLDTYSLQILPEFAAMEICSNDTGVIDDIAEVLAEKVTALPVAKLLPRNQTVPSVTELTWIQVVNYYYRLLQRCLWQKSSLEVSGSDWSLHYHAATPELYVKAHAMHVFLSNQFSPFRDCQLPPIPQYTYQQLSSHTHKLISANPSNLESHLLASECELTVIWQPRSHALSTGSNEENDQVTGFFAFNARPLHVPVQTSFHKTGADVVIVHTSLAMLANLRQEWERLVDGSHSFLQQKDASMYRPVSVRSAKSKKIVQLPDDLAKAMVKAVNNMARLFKVTKKELPKLEPNAVEHICRVLKANTKATLVNSPAFQFLYDLLATKTVHKPTSKLAI